MSPLGRKARDGLVCLLKVEEISPNGLTLTLFASC